MVGTFSEQRNGLLGATSSSNLHAIGRPAKAERGASSVFELFGGLTPSSRSAAAPNASARKSSCGSAGYCRSSSRDRRLRVQHFALEADIE
jgi:hypothetical protein